VTEQDTRVGTRLSTRVLVVFAVLVAGCHRGPAAATSTAGLTRPSIPSTTRPVQSGSLGERTFQIHQVRLAEGTWLTISLHPGLTPVKIRVTPVSAIEVCPASLEGGIGIAAGSWPHFPSCRQVDASGRVQLPATDGATHVAFAVRALDARRGRVVEVSVSYEAKDSFVELVPPEVVAAGTSLTFTPHTSTAGAHAYSLPGYREAPDIVISMAQRGRFLRTVAPCDFGSEIDCVGGVTPNQPVTVLWANTNSARGKFAFFVAWG
jgi:hypothetical protein